ncbi:glycosyltransferase [Microlunatus soli]|uniref:Glycosyltransferase, GT2 family n=1 Tax=Microlunatus soli TaxID=630515 RepID=A0A1H1SMB8_9ACTN|nr:glycosyltransferase [Microlunatus soli]SDS48856.1 Glycosyltransferase, GT2 family [Microlunatus soli]
MQTAGTTIALVVVNYGSAALIDRNVGDLAGGSGAGHRIVVVDNYSGEAERARVDRLCRRHGWTSVLLDSNTGFAGGVNAGLVAARGLGADAFLLLNPDAMITAETITALHDQVRANPLQLVAPRVTRPDGSTWAVGSSVDLRTGRMRRRAGLQGLTADEAPWVSGACLAFSRELLERTGGLPESYFLYWEDVDFSQRVRQVGGSLLVRSDLTVVHDEGGTQRGAGDRRLSDRYYYFNCRNRLLFAARQLDRRGVLRWMASTPRQSWQILLRGGRRQLLQSPAPLLAAIKGSVAGLGIAARSLLRRHRIEDDHGLDLAAERVGATGGGALSGSDSPITALMSFPQRPPKANPYRLLLERGLRNAPGLKIKYFSWRTALFGDYDVFHVHWPEILLEGSTPLKSAVRRALYLLFLARMRRRRIAIVRTMHNLELPRDIDRVEIALLRATERQTGLWIRLNTSTELPADRPGATILHGHYRDWYGDHPRSEIVPGRAIFYGLIRRYKGVPELVSAFTAGTDQQLSLHVLGRPSTEELADSIRAAAGDDHRVQLRLGFVEDPDLVAEITAAELVVLPYQEMHNSAAVLTALSLDRPVLIPDNEVNRKLAAEVGPGWIHTYDGPFSAAVLQRAVTELRTSPPSGRPDLEQRDWDLGGVQHADAYRVARRMARR